MRYISKIIIVILIMLSPSSAAVNIIEDILEMEFVDCISELTHTNEHKPDKIIQHSRHIHGWIDIVGFENMSKIDGKYYIPGNPTGNAIVRYDTWNTADGWNRAVDSFTETLTVKQTGEYLTAKLDIYLLWHSVRFDPYPYPHVVTTYHTERTVFKDTELVPNIFTSPNYNHTYLDIVIYNNSIQPKTSVRVVEYPEDVMVINYTYDNESIIHYLAVASIEYTPKNVAYMYLQDVNVWTCECNITHFDEFIIIPTANFTETNLTVTCSDPYNEVEITNYTVANITYTGMEDSISSLFWAVLVIVAIFICGAVYLICRGV